jgi:hypothetical protein
MLDSGGNQPPGKGRNNQMNYNTINLRGLAQLGLLAFNFAAAGFGQTPTPVVVKNGVREPIPIKNQTPQMAVAFKCTAVFAGSDQAPCGYGYTVPFGRRLVIEHITYNLHVGLNNSMWLKIDTTLDNITYTNTYGHTHRMSNDGAVFHRVDGNHTVKIYADAGTHVNVLMQTSSTNGQANAGRSGEAVIQGYLVEMPLVLQVAQ